MDVRRHWCQYRMAPSGSWAHAFRVAILRCAARCHHMWFCWLAASFTATPRPPPPPRNSQQCTHSLCISSLASQRSCTFKQQTFDHSLLLCAQPKNLRARTKCIHNAPYRLVSFPFCNFTISAHHRGTDYICAHWLTSYGVTQRHSFYFSVKLDLWLFCAIHFLQVKVILGDKTCGPSPERIKSFRWHASMSMEVSPEPCRRHASGCKPSFWTESVESLGCFSQTSRHMRLPQQWFLRTKAFVLQCSGATHDPTLLAHMVCRCTFLVFLVFPSVSVGFLKNVSSFLQCSALLKNTKSPKPTLHLIPH